MTPLTWSRAVERGFLKVTRSSWQCSTDEEIKRENLDKKIIGLPRDEGKLSGPRQIQTSDEPIGLKREMKMKIKSNLHCKITTRCCDNGEVRVCMWVGNMGGGDSIVVVVVVVVVVVQIKASLLNAEIEF